MKQFNLMRALGIAVVFAVALLGMTTKAEAHAGNSSATVIHACRGNALGLTRIVGVNGACTNLESAVHWDIVGPAGATGPAGAQGPAGAIGPAGATGPKGEKGDTGSLPLHFIGEEYGGGIVFYVYDGGQHGLIAATTDQSTGTWYNGVDKFTGTTGDGVGAGAMNTAMIVATQIGDNQTGNFAAKACADYSVTMDDVTYGDFYLPSKYELELMYTNIGPGAAAPLTNVGGFGENGYWSSTEALSNAAFSRAFFVGGHGGANYKGISYFKARAVRAF
jgi:hypothetical protein